MPTQILQLDEIEDQVRDCRKCPLYEGRTNIVFGDGSPHAKVMIVGEAPGKNEDLQGKPFVGAAGKYLDELLAIAGIKRDEVYIANVLKCRPPSNRNPKIEEIEQCADYLRGQTRTIMPEYIITLGNFATKFILKTDRGITSMRGKLVSRGKFKVLPVFHPAAALYDSSKKVVLEDDFAYLGELLAKSKDSQQDASQEGTGQLSAG